MRAYIETSFLNRSLDESICHDRLRRELEARDFHPVIGLHTIYEIARCFLGENPSVERGVDLAALIMRLEPTYLPSNQSLLSQELLRLRTNAAVLPFLSHLNQIATQEELSKLAMGNLDDRGREFITRREEDIAANLPDLGDRYLAHVREVRKRDPKTVRSLRTFDEVFAYFRKSIPDIIRKVMQGQCTPTEAREIAQRLDSFPATRSVVRANLYVSFIHIAHGNRPGSDKVDDYRHLIDASYTDVFLSCDQQLCRSAPNISPAIQAIPLSDLIGSASG